MLCFLRVESDKRQLFDLNKVFQYYSFCLQEKLQIFSIVLSFTDDPHQEYQKISRFVLFSFNLNCEP